MDAKLLLVDFRMLLKCDRLVSVIAHDVLIHLLFGQQFSILTIALQPQARRACVKIVGDTEIVFPDFLNVIIKVHVFISVSCVLATSEDIVRGFLFHEVVEVWKLFLLLLLRLFLVKIKVFLNNLNLRRCLLVDIDKVCMFFFSEGFCPPIADVFLLHPGSVILDVFDPAETGHLLCH